MGYTVKFTRAKGDNQEDTGPIIATPTADRYMCALSGKPLNNAIPCAVLRPSGKVVTQECVKKFIKKDMLDLFTDPPTKLKEKDIINIKIEGTGFSAGGTAEAKRKGQDCGRY